MERHLVRGRKVDLLHDIDLAALRPVRAFRPEPGPDGAPVRQVHGVKEEDGADGEVVVRCDPDLPDSAREALVRDDSRGTGREGLTEFRLFS